MDLDPLELLRKVNELNNKKRVKWSNNNFVIEHEPCEDESEFFDESRTNQTDSLYPPSISSREDSWSSGSRVRLSRENSSVEQISFDTSSEVFSHDRSATSMTSEPSAGTSNNSLYSDRISHCYAKQFHQLPAHEPRKQPFVTIPRSRDLFPDYCPKKERFRSRHDNYRERKCGNNRCGSSGRQHQENYLSSDVPLVLEVSSECFDESQEHISGSYGSMHKNWDRQDLSGQCGHNRRLTWSGQHDHCKNHKSTGNRERDSPYTSSKRRRENCSSRSCDREHNQNWDRDRDDDRNHNYDRRCEANHQKQKRGNCLPPPGANFMPETAATSVLSTEQSCMNIKAQQPLKNDFENMLRSMASQMSGERQDPGAFTKRLKESLAMRLARMGSNNRTQLFAAPPIEKPRKKDPCALKPATCAKKLKEPSPNYRSYYGEEIKAVVEPPCATSPKAKCPGPPLFCKPRKKDETAAKAVENEVDPQFKNTVTVCLQMLLENAINQSQTDQKQANSNRPAKVAPMIQAIEKLSPCEQDLDRDNKCKETTVKGKSTCKMCKPAGKSRRRRNPNCQDLQCVLASDEELVEQGDNFCATTESDLEDEPEVVSEVEEEGDEKPCKKKKGPCVDLDEEDADPEAVSGTLCTFLHADNKSVRFLEEEAGDEEEEEEEEGEATKDEEEREENKSAEEGEEEKEKEDTESEEAKEDAEEKPPERSSKEEVEEETVSSEERADDTDKSCKSDKSECDPCEIKELLYDMVPCPDSPIKNPCEARAVKSCEANVASTKYEPIVCRLEIYPKPASAGAKMRTDFRYPQKCALPTIPAVVVLPRRTVPTCIPQPQVTQQRTNFEKQAIQPIHQKQFQNEHARLGSAKKSERGAISKRIAASTKEKKTEKATEKKKIKGGNAAAVSSMRKNVPVTVKKACACGGMKDCPCQSKCGRAMPTKLEEEMTERIFGRETHRANNVWSPNDCRDNIYYDF